MYADTFPPAVVNQPPAYRSLPDTASALTLILEPNADQLLPFHLAMLAAAMSNAPPAYRSMPDTTNAITAPSPEPSADQVVPFHLAMPLTVTAAPPLLVT